MLPVNATDRGEVMSFVICHDFGPLKQNLKFPKHHFFSGSVSVFLTDNIDIKLNNAALGKFHIKAADVEYIILSKKRN